MGQMETTVGRGSEAGRNLKPSRDDLTVKFIISGTTSVMRKTLGRLQRDRQSRGV
jgi:hypothetical protein